MQVKAIPLGQCADSSATFGPMDTRINSLQHELTGLCKQMRKLQRREEKTQTLHMRSITIGEATGSADMADQPERKLGIDMGAAGHDQRGLEAWCAEQTNRCTRSALVAAPIRAMSNPKTRTRKNGPSMPNSS